MLTLIPQNLCYATTITAHKTKFQSSARKCVVLGFREGTKGYQLLDLPIRETLLSRHVVFYGNVFPFKVINGTYTSENLITNLPSLSLVTSHSSQTSFPIVHIVSTSPPTSDDLTIPPSPSISAPHQTTETRISTLQD